MLFIIIYLVIVFIVLLFMNTRVKIKINEDYFEIYIYKIRILKLEYDETKNYAFNNLSKYKFKKEDLKYLEILKSIDFRLIDVKLCFFQEDYSNNAKVFGVLNTLLSLPKDYFLEKGIRYNYKVYFYGNPFINFESIFYFKLGKILLNVWRLRRNIHGKRTSNS